MNRPTILQVHHHDIDIEATTSVYTDTIAQWGFRDAHTYLLQELQSWADSSSMVQDNTAQKLERILEIEYEMLTDAGIAGVAAEHLPFLYSVLGEVFENYGDAFRHALQQEAQHIERVREDAMHQQMRDTGCDRLEVVPYMESAALERIEDRRERVLTILNAHLRTM